MKKFKTLGLAAAALLLMSGTANATVFDTVKTKGIELFQGVRSIIFVIGGFGLVGLAVGAIFGRINWKWFGGLAFGLAVVAAAGAVVDYMTTTGGTGGATTGEYGDTLG